MHPYIQVGNRLIPMYGVCMALGILISSYMAFIRTRRAAGDGNSLLVIGASAVGCGLVGAKLLYVVVSYGVGNAVSRAAAGDLLFLSEGGQVFYGGLLGGIAGAYLGARIARVDLALYCDAIVPCIALGHAFGRLGCFFAGCCYGMPYDGPFSLSFPAVGVDYQTFPVQLLEMVINLGICMYLILYTRKVHGSYQVLHRYLFLYALARLGLESLRGDLIRGATGGLSTSQWISVVLLTISLLRVLWHRLRKKHQVYLGSLEKNGN